MILRAPRLHNIYYELWSELKLLQTSQILAASGLTFDLHAAEYAHAECRAERMPNTALIAVPLIKDVPHCLRAFVSGRF